MENYKLIMDEEALKSFINWLPDLLPNEMYFVSLLARRKYNIEGSISNLKADKNQLKRVTCTKDRIIEKIRQMECAYGSYLNNGVPIQQENLVVYISPNPRDCYKAAGELSKKLTDKIINVQKDINPQSLALNCIQTSCTRNFFYDLDIDLNGKVNKTKEELLEIIKLDLSNIINFDYLHIIETIGGFHILIELDKIEKKYKNSWYQNMFNYKNDLYNITMNGDNLIPLVGCFQGGFTVKKLN